MSAEVVGSAVELRNGLRAVVHVDGLDGWRVIVETRNGPTGTRIVRLELRALSEGTVLTASQLHLIVPSEILAAVDDPWVLVTGPDRGAVRPAFGNSIAPGYGEPIETPYLASLAATALRVQGKVKSTRRALAEHFNRTESQIRDDLHRARQLGYLMPSEPGSRRVVIGPNLTIEPAVSTTIEEPQS